MSFGGVSLPSPSSSGGTTSEERPPSSSNAPSTTPVPPVPPNFSANFSFQGSSAPFVPLPRTFPASSPRFPFPGPPSASPVAPRLPYPPPAFSYQTPSAHPLPLPGVSTAGFAIPGRPRPPHPISVETQGTNPSTHFQSPSSALQSLPQQPTAMDGSSMNSVPANAGSVGTVSSMTADEPRHAPPSGLPTNASQVRPLTPHAIESSQPVIAASAQTQQVLVTPAMRHGQVASPGQMAMQNSVQVRSGPPSGPQYRAPFSANSALPMVPPGVLGPAPAGMAPRFQGTPFVPMVRPPNFPRAPSPLVRGPLGSMMRPAGHVRPLIPEKPQTVVYVGKIAPTVSDEFLRSVLELCGPVKSWKRAQEPTVGSFGFCEFESPEGVLRALRLLNGFSLEGRDLKLTVTQAAREYLDQYIRKKKERELQLKQDANGKAEIESAPGVEILEPLKQTHAEAPIEHQSTEEHGTDEKTFGIVNDEDREGDEDAKEKLATLLEERAKENPLPAASMPTLSDTAGKSTSISDTQAKSREGDSVTDGGKIDGQDGTNEEGTSENKVNSEYDRLESSSSVRVKQFDNHIDRDGERDRVRDRESRERDRKREKEREINHVERERERIRARREMDREMRQSHAERMYDDREKAWEEREKEKERMRNVDREKEKERAKQRRRLIKEQEEESDDEEWKKGRRRDVYGERKRVQREREDDEKDCLKEEEEIVEAKRRKLKEDYEEQVKKRLAEMAQTEVAETATKAVETAESGSVEPEVTHKTEVIRHESSSEGQEKEEALDNEDIGATLVSKDVDEKCSTGPAPKKLGFGLIGAGKRAALPSVFIQEDEEDVPKERGLRPLVPIEYTAEEMEAVSSLKSTNMGSVTPNLAAAAEFAKSLLNLGASTARAELELDWDRGKERDRYRRIDGSREKEQQPVKVDTKQLIDAIPKTKEELFAYEIDWKIYDQHELHERMKPWIEKKITEFLGEEEHSLVEFILTHTRKHASAESMLELLTKIIDDEAEMFVMKMWRMLIFEIKKVESGKTPKSKT